jgi:hypothetical protein
MATGFDSDCELGFCIYKQMSLFPHPAAFTEEKKLRVQIQALKEKYGKQRKA